MKANNAEAIVPFDPNEHAGPVPAYKGSHVVARELPLVDITFRPEHDEIAQFVGFRDANVCPQIEQLTAQAGRPQIAYAETEQQLTVPCEARRQVSGAGVSYPVCSIRTAAAGLDIHAVPQECLTDPGKKERIWCPFMYLGGVVEAPGVEVHVAVDARAPASAPELTAVQ